MVAVAQAGRKRRPPSLRADLAVAHNHQAVHLGKAAVFQLIQKCVNRFAGNAHLFRQAALKSLNHGLFSSLPLGPRVLSLALNVTGNTISTGTFSP